MTIDVWRPAVRCAAYAMALMIALSPAAPLSAQQSSPPSSPPRWRGTIDLKIGGEDASDDASFGSISGLAVDAAGRIYVADRQDSQIKLFSPAGALLGRIGRAGSGPVEFRRLAAITIGPDRLLWVRDEGNARMIALDVTKLPATNVRSVPLRRMTGGSQSPITFAGSAIVDETIYKDKGNVFRPIRTRIALNGEIGREDTLRVPTGADAGIKRVGRDQKDAAGKVTGFSEEMFYQPFGPRWLSSYGPNGLRADAVSSAYEVRVYDSTEKLVRTLRRTVPSIALSPRERARAEDLLDAQAKDAKMTRAALSLGAPPRKPSLETLTWTQDGQLWIERTVADGAPHEADVYDPTGRWIAIAEWPRAIDLRMYRAVIIGKTLLSVTTDSSDVDQVIRMRFR